MSTYRDRVHALLTRRTQGASLDELVRETGWQRRSVEVILSRARNGRMPTGRAWSDAQDALLLRHWASENGLQIARRLQGLRPGVSHWAVNARARRLGLVKPGSPTLWKTERL